MESHPLNLAHQQHRRADAHLINNRYDEAMQCHHNAAELLLDAMKSTTSSVALESITLQHSYHLKQKDFIKVKKEQYARVKKAVDNIKVLSKDSYTSFQGNETSKLQVAIYRAINESDSLLNVLSSKQDGIELGLLRDVTNRDTVDGKRKEKSQETVVEELQVLSQNLHSLIEQLVIQVEVLKDENGTLKERVNYLEKERVKYLNLPSSRVEIIDQNLEEGSNDSAVKQQVPQVAQSHPVNAAVGIVRQTSQPHFDLSVLKEN